MKLRYVLPLVVAAGLGACSSPADTPSGPDRTASESGWLTPPRVGAVRQTSSGLVVVGTAAPEARVVLRGPQGVAFAANADAQGRFEVRMAPQPEPMIVTPEVQTGQTFTPALEQLLLSSGGVVALLTPGGASRRLDAAPGLDAVDGDGRGLVASGRGAPGQRVTVAWVGGGEQQVGVDTEGRWATALPGALDQPLAIRVGDATFNYPGPGVAPAAGQAAIERAGQGLRVVRALSTDARQTSWFPDAKASLTDG